MSLDAAYDLTLDKVQDLLRVTRVRGEERMHAPARFEAVFQIDDPDAAPLDLDAQIGKSATLRMTGGDAERLVVGVVEQIVATARGYRVVIAPRVAALEDSVDYRVFLEKTAVEIVEQLCGEHGVDLEKRLLREPPKRAQCVQAWETTLAFIGRILAEEGIAWHVECDSGADVVVLTDAASSYAALPGGESIAFGAGSAAGLSGSESLLSAELAERMTVEQVSLCDFDFEKPKLDTTVKAGEGSLEHFEYPGGYVDPKVGEDLAKMRLEEAQAGATVLTGRASSKRIAVGYTIKLDDAPSDALNRAWLITEASHEGADVGAARADERRHVVRFRAIPADKAFRAPRTAAPSLGGMQTATATGPVGSEIHTEAHGRIKVKLRWDRSAPVDDTRSAWVRPMQPPTSGGFFLPRVGFEVLLGFARGSGDEPIALGRLDHGAHPPAEGLPGKRVRGAFGSATTPGGGSKNMLLFDDSAGNEGLGIVASADYNERTEADKKVTVVADESHTVGADHTSIYGIVHDLAVSGAQSLTVGSSRSLTTVGQLAITAASESVLVGAMRKFKVGGDYETSCATLSRTVGAAKTELIVVEQNRHVTGACTVMVGGGWVETSGVSSSVGVLGASSLEVAGPLTITTSAASIAASSLVELYGSRKETAGGTRRIQSKSNISMKVGGALKFKGSKVVFKATSKITIKAGGATITITSSSIKIKGDVKGGAGSLVTDTLEVT